MHTVLVRVCVCVYVLVLVRVSVCVVFVCAHAHTNMRSTYIHKHTGDALLWIPTIQAMTLLYTTIHTSTMSLLLSENQTPPPTATIVSGEGVASRQRDLYPRDSWPQLFHDDCRR